MALGEKNKEVVQLLASVADVKEAKDGSSVNEENKDSLREVIQLKTRLAASDADNESLR